MVDKKVIRGVHYESVAGAFIPQLEKMIEIANKENAFVYESFNGVPFMVEPGHQPDDAKNYMQFTTSKERKIVIHDTIKDYKISDSLQAMTDLAKENDVVISRVQGRDFRVFKGMTFEEVFESFKTVMAMTPYLQEEKKKQAEPEPAKTNAFQNNYLEELYQKYLQAKAEADNFVKTDTVPLYQSILKIESQIKAKQLENQKYPSIENQMEIQNLQQRLVIERMKHAMSLNQGENLKRLEQVALDFWQKNKQIMNGANQNS